MRNNAERNVRLIEHVDRRRYAPQAEQRAVMDRRLLALTDAYPGATLDPDPPRVAVNHANGTDQCAACDALLDACTCLRLHATLLAPAADGTTALVWTVDREGREYAPKLVGDAIRCYP